jgi:transcriptional regulator with XRE-family HTH domain
MTASKTSVHGRWLREQRQARGWSISQMARKLRETATLAGDALPAGDTLATMIRRWEHGNGISERYQLHYCHALRIPPASFGTTPPDGTAPAREPVTLVLILLAPPPGRAASPANDPA